MKLQATKSLVTFLLFCLLSLSQAHWADLAVAEVNIYEVGVFMVLTFPTEIMNQLSDDNLDEDLQLEAFFSKHIVLSDEKGNKAQTALIDLENEDTHSIASLRYSWPEPVTDIKMHYGLFLPNVPTASMLATIIQGEQTSTVTFTPENRDVTLNTKKRSWVQQVKAFGLLGIKHILTGYDHLLFLVALLMLSGGIGYLIKIVSAFTVAHSITLSLAVLGIVNLPAQIVESIIALSIAFIAVENLWRKEKALRLRWLIVFGFGLLHGLGFAGILQEMPIPRSELALSLISFNLGVEIGQIAIVTVTFLLLQLIKKQPWEVYMRYWISIGVAAMGIFWFFERIFPLF